MCRSLSLSSFFAMLLLFGCTADDDGDDNAGDASSSSSAAADESSSTGSDLDALYDCVDPGIVEARPLVGPGFDPAMGGLVAPLQDTYIVSSTQVLVKPEMQNDFNELVGQVIAEIDGSDGMVAYSLSIEPTCGFARTLSVWRDAESMVAFATSDAHAMAVARTNEVAITGKVTHWTLAADAFPPTWDSAREELAKVTPIVTY